MDQSLINTMTTPTNTKATGTSRTLTPIQHRTLNRTERTPTPNTAPDLDLPLEALSGISALDCTPGFSNHFITHPSSLNRPNWKVQLKSRDSRTLILGDSNLRKAEDLINKYFNDTEIHTFPGANLGDVPRLLDSIPENNKIKNLVLAFGINNRDDPADNLNTTLKNLKEASSLTRGLTFVGISASPKLILGQKLTTQKINGFLKENFNFIEPLPDTDITVNPMDFHQIHHSTETVERVLVTISDFLYMGKKTRRGSP